MSNILQSLAKSRTVKRDATPRLRKTRFAAALLALAGSWKFWLCTALAAGTAAISVVIYREIHAAPDDKGNFGYQTLGRERVLLMNVDNNTTCPVTFESYAYNQSATLRNRRNYESYWTWKETDTVSLYNLKANANTELHVSVNGEPGDRLWSLLHCRHGNTHSSDANVQKVSNYLPHSDTSVSIGTTGTTAANDDTAGQIVMQNLPEAQVVSSCYPDGIGTVYFDAVNGFTDYLDGKIAVDVAYGVWKVKENGWLVKENPTLPEDIDLLETVDGTPVSQGGVPVPPDDAHCDEVRDQGEVVVPRYETVPFGRVAWVRAKLTGVKNANGVFTHLPTNDVVELNITTGTTTASGENFYRVWAPVSDPVVNPDLSDRARGPLRFRLKRVDDPRRKYPSITPDGAERKTSGLQYEKQNGLLLVDNVIASYPPMKVWAVPQGEYVPSGKKNVIGWTGAVSPVKYPAVGEKNLKAAAGLAFATNNPAGAKAGWLGETRASMTYRWRYMNQIVDEWKPISLAMQGDRLVSEKDFELPNLIGDVEFKYEVELDAPYYAYLDYSGSKKFTAEDPTPGYFERIKKVTSEFNPEARGQEPIPVALPSCGTNFFFRLRAGKSFFDQLEWQLVTRRPGAAACLTNAFWLVSDGTWKAFLRTTTNETSTTALTVGDYEFRIVGLDPAKTFGGNDVTEIPWNGKPLYSASNGEGWTKIHVDAVTGALMFQLLESAESSDFMTYTIVRSDFQDFALWDDAATTGFYTGAYFEGRGKQSGSSPDARQYPGEISAWNPSVSSNAAYWTEKFETRDTVAKGYGGYRAYEPFENRIRTPNGWQAWNGQWVCRRFREQEFTPGGEMAFQLGGDKSGGLEFTSVARAPRGVDQLTLKARIAQAQTFDDFAYSFGGALSMLKDYVFTARAVMSTTAAATDFDGSGSVSLVGYYQPRVGCYELRAERIGDDTVRLYLYKWLADKRTVKATLIGYHDTSVKFSTESYLRAQNEMSTSDDQYAAFFGELFIRCRTVGGQAEITAGVMKVAAGGEKKLSDPTSGTTHLFLIYRDSAPDNPLTFGSYGFGSINCEARIANPQFYSKGSEGSFPKLTDSGLSRAKDKDGNDVPGDDLRTGSASVTYPSGGKDSFETDQGSGYADWSIGFGAFKRATFAGKKAVQAVAPTGELELFTRNAQGAGDDEVSQGTKTVSGFKYNDITFTVRNHEDTLVRLSTADESDDIVVDDVSFNQWCASSYDDVNGSGQYINADFNAKTPSLGCPTNWTYQNGWVTVNGTAHTVDLQPARVKGKGLVQVRAPLMDGYDGRGIGLGQIAFSYRNADPNCVLRVQYAPVNGASYLRETTSTTNGWIDVAVIDFSAPPYDEKRAEGTVVTYVGEHGFQGAMRILVDPGVVKAVVDDPSLGVDFGRITITDFRASDEPALDGRCWWGWNLRTTRDEKERSLDDSLDTQPGLAAALNNDVFDQTEKESDEETDEERRLRYAQHVPFVQSPTFGTNIVGEISFKARKLRQEDPATEVAVLGAKDGGVSEDSNWECLDVILVTNAVFSETYSYKTQSGKDYASFRLAVIGVDEVNVNYRGRMLPEVPEPQRVLIDDVAISEAVRAKLGFRDVRAFRTGLEGDECIEDIMDVSQQPLCREPWGVQGEVYVAQLGEEIDMDVGFQVRMHWFFGTEPWGLENWVTNRAAKAAELRPATATFGRYVFRSSYKTCPDAVVSGTMTNCTVQYALEVLYRPKGENNWATNWISSADWEKPSWYRGIDYNRGRSFSPYTILDMVAPGYAWINEVNVFGSFKPVTWANSDENRQYVEVGMPRSADLTGWKLRFLDPNLQANTITTNDVATFGYGVNATKDKNVASNCVFLVVACPGAQQAKTLDPAKGEVDGYWRMVNRTGAFSVNQTVVPTSPIGIQLVRPSGILEHEILMIGTNTWEGSAQIDRQFDPQKYIDFFNAHETDGNFIFAGKEHGGDANSLGVTNGLGTVSNQWTYARAMTPGRINEGQQLPFATPPTPFGSMLLVYANLGPSGRIAQILNEGEFRTSQMIMLKKGGEGTNLVYRVDPWYEMGYVKTNDVAATWRSEGGRTYSILVGKGSSNDTITVEADAVIDHRLEEEWGLTPDNRYRDAVMDWLSKGKDLYGNDWAAPASGVVKPARFWPHNGDLAFKEAYSTNLDLTTMYWLDIDPTRGGWLLDAGTVNIEKLPADAKGKENVRVSVFMVISNKNEQVDWPEAQKAHAPYALRGLGAGESSLTYSPVLSQNAWTSETFKIVGFMNNGLNRLDDPDNWVPVRWFVFNEGSFGAKGTDEAYTTHVDVDDPYSKDSPGRWYEWYERHGTKPGFFWSWRIDGRNKPRAAEVLTPHAEL